MSHSTGDYSPAGAVSSMKNSTGFHPQWSAPSLQPKTVYHFFSRMERLFFTCNSKFVSECPLAVCMNEALLTDVVQSYDKTWEISYSSFWFLDRNFLGYPDNVPPVMLKTQTALVHFWGPVKMHLMAAAKPSSSHVFISFLKSRVGRPWKFLLL